MTLDKDRTFAMVASKDERIQSYLETTQSTDDIVRAVTQAFNGDVERILAEVKARRRQTRARNGTGTNGASTRRRVG